MKTKKTIEILVGIPCSGKSTYANEVRIVKSEFNNRVVVLSRDDLRDIHLGKNYKPNKKDENKITEYFNEMLENALNDNYSDYIILDNTHCKEAYIDNIITKYSNQVNIKLTFFDISLTLAHTRNTLRMITSGKWIPFKVIKQMKINYDKINKQKYEKYI